MSEPTLYNEPLFFRPPLISCIKSYSISVLLIDDQLIISEAIRRMLADQEDIGFHYCSDPKKALDVAIQVRPTVILQDLMMPGFDGLLLVKCFKANVITSDIPLIVLSTKEDPRIKAEAFALGANDYVVKLPDKLELLARIRYHSNGYIRLLQRNEAYQILEESQRVLNAELAEAAGYVRSLLPKPLTQGDIQTNWRFIPSAQLGGDAFGYHWLDEENFAIYLLDVCGHGVGAALLSISIVNLLSSQNLPADFKDPSCVLRQLNLAFQMEKHNNMFFTMWYGVYNRSTRQLIYASGGHPPAILITGGLDEKPTLLKLKTDGVVIGAIANADYTNASCLVKPFNRLYVFSDGVYEIIKPDGGMLGLENFIHALKNARQSEKTNELEDVLQFAQHLNLNKKSFNDDFSILQAIFNFA